MTLSKFLPPIYFRCCKTKECYDRICWILKWENSKSKKITRGRGRWDPIEERSSDLGLKGGVWLPRIWMESGDETGEKGYNWQRENGETFNILFENKTTFEGQIFRSDLKWAKLSYWAKVSHLWTPKWSRLFWDLCLYGSCIDQSGQPSNSHTRKVDFASQSLTLWLQSQLVWVSGGDRTKKCPPWVLGGHPGCACQPHTNPGGPQGWQAYPSEICLAARCMVVYFFKIINQTQKVRGMVIRRYLCIYFLKSSKE